MRVSDQMIRLLDGVFESVAEHPELLHDDDHVEDGVAVGVLGVGVGALLYEEIVDGLVTETGGPGQRVLAQVGEALVVGVDGRDGALLVPRVEESPRSSGANVRPGLDDDLGQLVVTVGDSEVESREAAVLLALNNTVRTED